MPRCPFAPSICLVLAWCLLDAANAPAARPDGQLEMTVVHQQTAEPIAVRMTLRDPRKRPVRQRGLGVAPLGDHFYVDGRLLLPLRRGEYTFDLDAGPEFHPQTGHFEILRRSEDTTQVEMRRAANLQKEGWVGADLDAPRATPGLATAMRAERLGFAAHIGWRREGGKWIAINKRTPRTTADDTRPVGAAWGGLRFYPGEEPFDKKQLSRLEDSAPSLTELRSRGCRVVAADLADWRLPVWLAYDALDAAMLVDRTALADHSRRGGGRPPGDPSRYRGARGAGRWREAIYFHVLNTGLRLPPVAGSGSGETESPLGAARVYANLDNAPRDRDQPNPDAWWSAVAAGSTFVTTGPLLRPSVSGRPPGHTFYLDAGQTAEFQVALSLTTRERIEYLELLQNGEVTTEVSLRDVAKKGGRLPPLAFDGPGWFAVRAANAGSKTYRRAMSAPYYVTRDGAPRISERSCRFFLEGIDQLAERDASSAEEIATARRFWQSRLAQANAP